MAGLPAGMASHCRNCFRRGARPIEKAEDRGLLETRIVKTGGHKLRLTFVQKSFHHSGGCTSSKGYLASEWSVWQAFDDCTLRDETPVRGYARKKADCYQLEQVKMGNEGQNNVIR